MHDTTTSVMEAGLLTLSLHYIFIILFRLFGTLLFRRHKLWKEMIFILLSQDGVTLDVDRNVDGVPSYHHSLTPSNNRNNIYNEDRNAPIAVNQRAIDNDM